MRTYLLPKEGRFFKANLHCHSTCSDGALTPQQLKDEYKARGYSILAITDHEILLDHSDLNDDDFLTITSYEISINESAAKPFDHIKTCHLNFYAKDPHNTAQVCSGPNYIWGNAKKYLDKCTFKGESFSRVYTPECINEMIKIANQNGFFVCYNHPSWSLETLYEYGSYDGFLLMEVYNNSAYSVGNQDKNLNIYETLLRMGKRVYCVASDDNHNRAPLDHPLCDSFGGFTMIKAENLTYASVIEAIEKGNLYASCGPEIKELYIEDGKVHITCSPAKDIFLGTHGRRARRCRAKEGEYLTQASFDILEEDIYIRLHILDEHGKGAYTRGYFLDELNLTF